MNEELFGKLWRRFLSKEFESFKKRKRNYLHFDRKIGFSKDILDSFEKFEILFNKRFLEDFRSGKASSRSYYPFIEVTIETPRYKFDPKIGRRRLSYKSRPICFAAHFDAIRHSWFATILDYCYEEMLRNEECNASILAYRKLKGKPSNIDFAFRVFEEVESRECCVALAFDVKKFFEKISHNILKDKWIEVLRIVGNGNRLPEDHFKLYETLTEFRYVQKKELKFLDGDYKITGIKKDRLCSPEVFRVLIRNYGFIQINKYYGDSAGIPQGSPISAVLANISMLDFDREFKVYVNSIGGKYYRYSDDLMVICDDKFKNEADSKARELIAKLRLEFNDKTEIIHFKSNGERLVSFNEQGNPKKLQYLGFEFDGENVYIRSSSLARYHRKMKRAVGKALAMTYGKYTKGNKVRKSKLLKRFTQAGDSNFITYAKRAAMDSNYNYGSIQRQYKLKQYKNLKKAIVSKDKWNRDQSN